MTENDFSQFVAWAKMASIAREFSGECFDFDCLCASCLGRLVLKREQNDSASTVGAAWSIFGLTRSNGHSAVSMNDFLLKGGNLSTAVMSKLPSLQLECLARSSH